ncbi:hypothetical protein [Streptomyces zagrosensis]|uniref:Uncharacterized protein n=1 Tax=Streptomyces zagrosensis TaxID=1042984 RepID=A0A7W9QJ72_9ACTN|nr:hypothetical protein [Streptomyces zagrosensis]MBB5940242.1 hypothetical protein [Streptomyces zagrosensis]
MTLALPVTCGAALVLARGRSLAMALRRSAALPLAGLPASAVWWLVTARTRGGSLLISAPLTRPLLAPADLGDAS